MRSAKSVPRLEASDSKDLARCLMRLSNDAGLVNRLRQAGQRKVQQRFSVIAAITLETGFKPDTAQGVEAKSF